MFTSQSVLAMKETPPVTSLPQPCNTHVAVEIVDATFTWDSSLDQVEQYATAHLFDKHSPVHCRSITNKMESIRYSSKDDNTSTAGSNTKQFEALRNINITLYKVNTPFIL